MNDKPVIFFQLGDPALDVCGGVAVGALVRQLRTEKGWSLEDFSREAGISVPWLRKFEENKLTTNYSMRLQMQMVQALGFGLMEIHQFYKRVDEMTEASVGPPPWLINNKKGGPPR